EKISAKDFSVNSPVVDQNANAVVLVDVGSTDFEGNNNGDFSLVFKHQKRILLKSRNAFDDATIKIPIYLGQSTIEEEMLDEIEATTYNLENGKIVETKLDKGSIFKEKYNRVYSIRKFTFPNIKEGSIIEYKYTIKSPYYRYLRGWDFQGKYPVLWSQYQVTIPPMFTYLPMKQGFLKYTIDSSKLLFKSYTILDNGGNAYSRSDIYNLSGDARFSLWAIKDVPAFKEEGYVSSYKNYFSKISFQPISIRYSENNVRRILKDWFSTVVDLMKDPDFGLPLTENNSWMNDELKQIKEPTDSKLKIKKIYSYVRDNYKCIDYEAMWLSQPLKKTFQTKTGNVADINLLLVAMLKHEGFEACPVILSTKDNGKVNSAMPLLNEYNYVLAKIKLQDESFVLDASHNHLGFGKLVSDCYNGDARIIDKMPLIVNLNPDSLKETKRISLFFSNGEKGEILGSYTKNCGNNESYEVRDFFSTRKKEEYIQSLKKSYPSECQLTNFNIDSLQQLEEPIGITYDLKLNFNNEDIVYFNPLLSEQIVKNPFVSAERMYPVEMNYKENMTYTFNMEIPVGYVVDELPKSARVKLNDNEGMFEYIITSNEGFIQMRTKLILEKATFNPEDYATLRDFYGFVVKKHAEQIVFKKAK
ncbi:MAG: transglutaminase domain-containing protein, partial [Chitinophagaceae bacterium]